MMKRPIWYILLSGIVLTPSLRAQDVGGYGYLSLPVSAHAAALGGTAVSVVEPELGLAEQNPALLCPETGRQVALGYMNYLSDIHLAYAGYGGQFLAEGGWTASARLLSYGDFERYDAQGIREGTFSAQETALSAGLGYPVSDRWRVGALARALYSKYESYTAFALAVDVGLNYYDEVAGRSVGITLTGLGGQIRKLDDRRTPLKADLTAGWSKEIEHLPFCLTLTACRLLDWDDEYVDGSGTVHACHGGEQLLRHLNFAAEWIASDQVWFAAGYNYRRQRDFSGAGGFLRGLSAGAGFTYRMASIQVAYARYNTVDGSLSVGIAYQF